MGARVVIAVALAVAGVACGWAWQLQQELEQSGEQLAGYEKRVASLEDLLSDTDETVNRSSAAMSAQLKMLDTEVRKLWDARKASNASLAKLEKSDKSQIGQLSGMKKIDDTSAAQLKTLLADVTRLKTVAGDLERLSSSAKVNQAEVERVADALNRINLDMAKLNKRVQGNEEWVESMNAFRRQISTKLAQLEASIRALQGAP
jgi:chromosome segregation ATPase